MRSALNPARYTLVPIVGDTCVDLQVTAVPEPETLGLLAVGLLGLQGVVARRRGDRGRRSRDAGQDA
ncbi:PEP-CTERM sorting domain-containing protein [Caldimonas brevitalea]|uniref:PEP-CTERM sorting domain-containing protein n=1 Tax=Caldimonas brevitalea TaxID=413882 RepID=UPI0009F85BDC|nr:PEP-CTERM sorting domain-containing protein [Caldimonas brevitalea]